jgi:NADPH-dependent 2,4-dienoyl-CoA reductase/sulfur reductase-like enzyme
VSLPSSLFVRPLPALSPFADNGCQEGRVNSYKYVVLGGGMVAGYAAREFVGRGIGPGELGIVSADDVLPYERPPLSKGFLQGSDTGDSVLINNAAFYTAHGIDVRLQTPVEHADLINRTLRLRGGGEWRFDRLLIATGARVRTLKVPGATLDGIFYLRTLGDSRRIRDRAARGKRAVVIGGGFIGMEAAASLTRRGLEVTLVLAEERIWQRFFTPEMSAFFRRYYEERGVAFLVSAQVTGFTGRGRLEAVTAAGRSLPADLVVAGVGVAPETALFENTGAAIDDGILVNQYLETSVPGVYAAGDVANYRDVLAGRQRRLEHWDNAVEQGRHAARVMTGLREPFEHVPYFFSDVFDLSYEFWGDSSEADRTVTRGDPASNSFSVWWLREDRLTAAFVMARPEEERDLAQRWIRSRAPVSAAALADASRPLESTRAGAA